MMSSLPPSRARARFGWGVLAASFALLSLQAQPKQTPPPGPPGPPPRPDVWNFTAVPGELEIDGFRDKIVYIGRNEGRVSLTVPEGWISAGSSSELAFINPKIPGARLSLRKSALPIPKEFDATWKASLKDILAGAAPGGAKNVVVSDLTAQPINMAGSKTFEGRCTFDLAGDRFVWNFVFIRIHDLSMLEAVAISRESDFKTVRGTQMSLLPSWLDMPKVVPRPPGNRANR